jgi:hypothetical protein
MPPTQPAVQSALRDHRTQSCAIPEMADSRLRRRASRSEEGCHAMSHRLRLVVDEEVRAAGYELGLQAGYVVLVKRDGILQLVLHAEQHQRGHAQPASAVAPAHDPHELREDELPVQRTPRGRGRARAARRGTRRRPRPGSAAIRRSAESRSRGAAVRPQAAEVRAQGQRERTGTTGAASP